ncbi:response regulator [Paenibacillus sp. GCM10027628]|uniref:response regulator transcription factor n=1 Tax=Paenibacillus sp. GCM10027628 TaxID=3273413 RepID=UPI00363789B4
MIKTLIVDDEPWNRELIKRFGEWEANGMEIVGEAEEGTEAIQLIERLSPDLVITDMRMPGMDGIAFIRHIYQCFPHIQIIVISGYDDFVYAKQAILCQAKDYLLKPIDPKELNQVLQKCRAAIEAISVPRKSLSLDIEQLQLIKSVMPALSLYVAELKADKVEHTFQQLLIQLQTFNSVDPVEWERIYQEFMLLLNELMMKNLLKASSLLSEEPVYFSSCDQMIEGLTKAYSAAIDQLVQERKYKNKMNLLDIKTYIDHNYTGSLTVEKIAQAFFVSNVYLSRAFRSEFGLTITDYIQHLRMERAKEWLLSEQTPIKTVAELCGYEDVAYFYRVFKKHFGVAPGEMRKG